MAESIFLRVRRIVSATVEEAVDAMERAGGTGVMREAIRVVDRAIDEVRAEHDAAATRGLQATRQQRLFRERIAGLDEKARFALAEGRQDLAEAAIARQLDFEAQAARLETVQTDAATEAARLDECLIALRTRKTQMGEALEAFELAQRDASFGGEGSTRTGRTTEKRVERAEAAFDRAMAGAGGAFGVIANASFLAIDHPGRAFIGVAIYLRHCGLSTDRTPPAIATLASTRLLTLARLLAALMRIAYPISVAMPGVLPRASLLARNGSVVLTLPRDLAALASERLENRLKALGRMIDRQSVIAVG